MCLRTGEDKHESWKHMERATAIPQVARTSVSRGRRMTSGRRR
jgi:hypothetical protein